MINFFKVTSTFGYQANLVIPDPIIKIGRDLKSHIVLDSSFVSRIHAVIDCDKHNIYVTDLGNEPCTQVNGESVNKAKLSINDKITIGDYTIEYIGAEDESTVEHASKKIENYSTGRKTFTQNMLESYMRADEAIKGYHLRKIEKGILGEPSKIREELEELEDALEQNNRIMALVELSDLYGAVKAAAEKLGSNMDELKIMSKATARAFKDGTRKPRDV